VNTNALRDEDTVSPLLYVAACGPAGATGWPGAVLFISKDGGVIYDSSVSFPFPATIGNATDALANWTHGFDVVDSTSHVNVQLTRGTLSSVTFDQFLLGVNAAILGGEVLFFQNANLESDGSYTLTNLLRARRGTDFFTGTHQAGDRFVLVSSTTIRTVPMSNSDINATYKYKAVTVDSSPDATPAQSFLFEGANLKTYSGIDAKATRSSGDITIVWTRRDKAASDLLYGDLDCPMTEASESYEVDIFTDNTFATVKRTLTATTPSVLYTSAQQTTDFGSPQSTVYCKIYQLSAVVGRGYPLKVSL
jgi:hypothetical protein